MTREPPPRRSVFPGLQDRAERPSPVVGDLAEERRRLGLSQTEVAERMGTSQSAVARLETGAADVRLSTLERYADAVGRSVELRLRDAPADAVRDDVRDAEEG